MKLTRALVLISGILLLAGAANAGTTTIRHTVDYTCNGGTVEPWFIPPDVITDHPPYYRGMLEDWGWTHDLSRHVPADAKGILSAHVTISAWDVDANDPEGAEVDIIYANSVKLGTLEDTNGRAWKTTRFDLPREVLDDLWTERKVYIFMDIDNIRDMVGHRVTLNYATLTVDYDVFGPGTPSRLAVHRFWSPAISSYFYTASEVEREKLVNNYAGVWTYQGVAYHALPPAFEPNSAPVHRFWSDILRTHFYTISTKERDKLIDRFSGRWTYEGEVFWAFPVGQQAPGTIPVYRFWSDTVKRHFYTTNEAQKDKLIIENSDVWTYEGIAWYAYE
jgi:hypothetical protein